MNRNMARVVLITAGAVWGIGFVVNKYILNSGWNDSQLLFIRFLTATVAICAFYYRRILQTNFETIKWGMFLGVLLYLGFYFQTWGLVHTTASNNALITAGYIVLMPVVVYIMERTHIPFKTIIAGVVTLIGISIITVDFGDISGISLGDTLTFIGAFFYSIHIYFLGKKTKQVDLFVLMSFQLIMFSFLAFIVMMINGGLPSISFSNSNDVTVLLAAIIIGFFGSFLGFLFQSIGQKYTNPAEAAILISTESLFGPLFAILLLNEEFSLKIVVGAIFVFGGIILSEIDINAFLKAYLNEKE